MLARANFRPVTVTLVLGLMIALTATAFATDLVGTDNVNNKLLYLTTPKTNFTMFTTGAQPAGVVIGPFQQIIYAVSATGQVHLFNPYNDTDTLLVSGLTSPLDVVMDPGCKSFLISDPGANKIYRFTFTGSVLSTFYSGDTIRGIVYDTLGNLFANDLTLNAVVQFSTGGIIVNQTPSSSPLTTADGLTYDAKSRDLFATSTTAQVIYQITDSLLTVTSIPFAHGPVLEGISSDGQGDLYVVGGTGASNVLYEYTISTGATKTLNTAGGLDRVAVVPFGQCISSGGTIPECQ
jgi:hypothetical protein